MANPNQSNEVSSSGEGNKNTIDPNNLNEWTIMIYHSGESGLSEELVWSLKEMARAGTRDKVEVIALMDSISLDLWEFTISEKTANSVKTKSTGQRPSVSAEREEDDFFHSKKLVAKRNPKIEKPEERLPEEIRIHRESSSFARPNLASSELLRNFIIQTINQHPAQHYMLVLSGHGDGMLGQTLLLDQGAGRFMSVPKLDWALGEISKEIGKVSQIIQPDKQDIDSRLDILGFDSCGMLTAEVSHLLRDEVKYIVGSEGIMRQTGWPYHLILDYLKTNMNVEPDRLAKVTVQHCVDYYADYARVGLSIDMAAVKMDQIGEKDKSWKALITAIKNLTERLSDSVEDRQIMNAVITAHWYAQSYAAEQYVDLYDFCEQLKSATSDLSDLCDAIIKALTDVVLKSCYAGGEFQHSHGLSLYFPWCATDKNLKRYKGYTPRDKERTETPFNRDTGWGEFLQKFINATRRKPREGVGASIFMPPPGYRDHLKDRRAKLETNSSEGLATRPGGRNTVQDHRNTAQDHRLGIQLVPFAKVKNPSLEFYENQCNDSGQGKQ